MRKSPGCGDFNTIMGEVGNGPVEGEFRQKQEYQPKHSWTVKGRKESWWSGRGAVAAMSEASYRFGDS